MKNWEKLFSFLVAAWFFAAAPSFADVFSMTRYVRVDHMNHTAYAYDENFKRLPDNPFIPGSSVQVLPDGVPLWLKGATIDMVRRNPDGSVDVVSSDPAYHEMNHHMVWFYASPNRVSKDNCGIDWPMASGSELTDIAFPSEYAYKLDGGYLVTGTWHWANPAGVPMDEEVYVRFVFHLDNSPSGYKDVYITWVGTSPCDEEFVVPPGKYSIEGPQLPVNEYRRLVAVYPHVHDHAKYLELRHNGDKLRRFKPEYASIPVAHDDVGEGPTPMHVSSKHLPADGLTAWTPGAQGPVVAPGDTLSAFSRFRNPHERAIDNMALFVTVWEELEGLPPDHEEHEGENEAEERAADAGH